MRELGEQAASRRGVLDRTHLQRVFEFSLLGMLASGYLAVLGSRALDVPSAILGACALVARILHLLGWMPLNFPGKLVNAVTIAYVFFYPLDYFVISKEFLTATVHLVFFVAVVKLLTASTTRDYLFLKIIAFLELLAASLLSDNLTFFVFLIVFLFSTVATFASSEMLASWEKRLVVSRGLRRFPQRFGALTMLTATGILAITGGLFFVLPRTARAALERLIPGQARTTGIASEVTLGQVGELRRPTNALLHVRFENPPPSGIRYRGSALGEFNGWKWYNTPQQSRVLRSTSGQFRLATDDQLRRRGMRLNYEVLTRGLTTDQLFLIGSPEYLRLAKPTIWETSTGSLRLPWPEGEGLRYAAFSYWPPPGAPAPINQKMAEADRNFYLRLPPVDPRLMTLAQQVVAGAKTDQERAQALERYFQTQFRYSLEPLERQVDDPLTYFLLERKQGHCEYFASSMAVFLRLLWIPSRVVTGFQSGTYNSMSGWHVIRASDAHSWVEAWIPGRGWVEFDPTPADPSRSGLGAFGQIALMLDAADLFWQDWVVGYDLERQLTLAIEVERSSRRFRWDWWEALGNGIRSVAKASSRFDIRMLGWVVLAAGLVAAVWFGWKPVWLRVQTMLRMRKVVSGRARHSDAGVLYESLLAILRRRGIEKPRWMTPQEFGDSLPASPAKTAVQEFTSGYYELRFGGAADRAPQLVDLLTRIRQIPL